MPSPLSERARGRWTGLLPLLGIDPRFLTNRQGPCPICAGKTRFRFDDKEGRGTWICNHCGAGDGADLAMRVAGCDFREIAQRIDALIGTVPVCAVPKARSSEDCRASLQRLWRRSRPVQPGDAVSRYLAARVGLREVPSCLRTAERLKYLDETPSWHPGMIAMVTAPDGSPATLHRTYLTPDGRKAAVGDPRRLMPGATVSGAAVRLFPASDRLGIAEGIETAFAAASLFGVPVWAAVNSTMLAKWQPPDEVREVIVFGDSDAKFAGQAAAYALAHRLAVRGRRTRVELPSRIGSDWNDVLLETSQAA